MATTQRINSCVSKMTQVGSDCDSSSNALAFLVKEAEHHLSQCAKCRFCPYYKDIIRIGCRYFRFSNKNFLPRVFKRKFSTLTIIKGIRYKYKNSMKFDDFMKDRNLESIMGKAVSAPLSSPLISGITTALESTFTEKILSIFSGSVHQLKIFSWASIGCSIIEIISLTVALFTNKRSYAIIIALVAALANLGMHIYMLLQISTFKMTDLLEHIRGGLNSLLGNVINGDAESLADSLSSSADSFKTDIGHLEAAPKEHTHWTPVRYIMESMTEIRKMRPLNDKEKELFREEIAAARPTLQSCSVCLPMTNWVESRIDNHTTLDEFMNDREYQGMPTASTTISLVLGSLALAVTVMSYCGNTSAKDFSKNVIHGNSFRKAVKETVTDSRELVESLAKDCFDFDLSPLASTVNTITKHIETLDTLMGFPMNHFSSSPAEYYTLYKAIDNATACSTELHRGLTRMPQNVTNAYTLLNQAIVKAKDKHAEISKYLKASGPRVETVPFHFVGRPGAGKTYFVNHRLIPEIAKRMGWQSDVYALNFAGQIYFPPYMGQYIGLYDEYLMNKDLDPILGHFNLIASTTACNLPGADVQLKVQPCLLRALLCISNVPYCNLRAKMNFEAEKALYSRFYRFEIVNKLQSVETDGTRDEIPHTEDYSEFEIRKFLKPASEKSEVGIGATPTGVDTKTLPDPYEVITLEQLIDHIVEILKRKEDIYNATKTPRSERLMRTLVNQVSSANSVHSEPVAKGPIEQPRSSSALSNVNIKDETLKKILEFRAQRAKIDAILKQHKDDSFDFTNESKTFNLKGLFGSSASTVSSSTEGEEETPHLNGPIVVNASFSAAPPPPPQENTVVRDFTAEIDKFAMACASDERVQITSFSSIHYTTMHSTYDSLCATAATIEELPSDLMTTLIQREWLDYHLRIYNYLTTIDETPEIRVMLDKIQETYGSEFQSEATLNHFNVLMCGPPGTGKTYAAEHMARELSGILSMPYYSITCGKLSDFHMPDCPSVVVLNDKLTDEEGYVHFYDALPSPSIIINTCNLSFVKKTMGQHTAVVAGDYVSKEQNLFSRTIQFAVDFLSTWRVKGYMLQDYGMQRNSEPGFIRRLGLPGMLFHSGQKSHRAHDTCEYIISREGFKLSDGVTEKPVLRTDIVERVYKKYLHLLETNNITHFRQIKDDTDWTIMETDYDVHVGCNSVDELKNLVNNNQAVLSAYFNAVENKKSGKAFIQITKRVRESSYIFSPSHFRIENYRSIEDVKQMAMTSFSTLKSANSNFTCLISAGDFVARCKGSTIEFVIHESVQARVGHLFHEVIMEGEKPVVLIKRANADGEIEVEGRYAGQSVIDGLRLGFQHTSPDKLEYKHVQIILANSDAILKHPLLSRCAINSNLKRLKAGVIKDRELVYYSWWTAFKESKVFCVILIILTIILAVGTIMALINIGKMLFKSGSPKEKFERSATGIPSTLFVDGVVLEADARVVGNRINVDLRTTQEFTAQEQLNMVLAMLIEAKFGDKYEIGDIVVSTIQSSDYTNDMKNKISKGKKMPSAPVRRIEPVVASQSKTDGAGLELWSNHSLESTKSIKSKILEQQVFVRGPSYSCYGLAIKGDLIVVPAHIFKGCGEIAQVTCPSNYNRQSVPFAMRDMVTITGYVIALDAHNDIALVRLDSREMGRKKLMAFADITKYFIEDRDVSQIHGAALTKWEAKSGRNDWNKHQVMSYLGYATPRTLITAEGQQDAKAWVYSRLDCSQMPTAQGDCGSLYFSTDTKTGCRLILGLHSTTRKGGLDSTASLITQEYIHAILGKLKPATPFYTISEDHREYQGIKSFHTEITDPAYTPSSITVPHPKYDSSVKLVIDPEYEEWYDALTQQVWYERDDDGNPITDIWYDAEDNPEGNLWYLGFDVKARKSFQQKPMFFKASFHEVVDAIIPNECAHTVVDSRKVEDKSALVYMSGKKSILGTQISFYNDPYVWDSKVQLLLDRVLKVHANRYVSLYGTKHRPLTNLEVINGLYINPRDPHSHGLESLDFQSSVGHYGKRFLHCMDKLPFFKKIADNVYGRHIYNWNDTPQGIRMMNRVMNCERLASINGERLMTPAEDNLKAEALPFAKVKKGATRCFQNMDLSEVYLIRKYTGTAQAAIKLNHDKGYCQVGIDPISGFQNLYDRFRLTSDVGEAGDFKRWDKHLTPQIISAAMSVLRELYLRSSDAAYRTEWHEAQEKAWKVMEHMIIYTICVADGNVYMKMRGNPSGNVLTAVLNSTVNDLYHLMAVSWLIDQHNEFCEGKSDEQLLERYGKEFTPYLPVMRTKILQTPDFAYKNTDWATYGDDFISVIAPKYSWLINFKEKQKFFTTVMGIEYDTPDKDGTTYTVKPLSQLQFLSRDFAVDETQTVFPRLKKVSISKMLHWFTTLSREQYKQNFENALQEAALWDKQYYDTVVKAINAAIEHHMSTTGQYMAITIMPYEQIRKVKRNEIRFSRL